MQFIGLSFQHSQWLTPSTGVSRSQGASEVDAAIMADDVRHITIANCDMSHLGRYAIWLQRGCRGVRPEQNLIEDLGAGGVRIGETQKASEVTDPSDGNTVDNNGI
jgi:hypothetical protein